MNSPECIKAQEIVSVASDGEELSAEEVRLAKAHCSECASCTSFVRGLASIRNLPGPQPPESTVTAAVAAVREIAASVSAAQEQSAAGDASDGIAARDVSGGIAARDVGGGSTTKDISPGWVGEAQRILQGKGALAWVGAAASIVVIAAAGTIVGVNYLLEAPPPVAENATTLQADAIYEQPVVPPTNGVGVEIQPERAQAPANGGRFIVFNGFVYEVDERRERPPAGDPTASIMSDLGSGQIAAQGVHISSEDNTILFVAAEDGAYEARLVTRTLDRNLYALRSSPIDMFGVWPTLPTEFTTPESPDGSPVFESAGTDDRGAQIFVPVGKTPAEGFAIAPEPPTGDPMAGSQNWTWWAPFSSPD